MPSKQAKATVQTEPAVVDGAPALVHDVRLNQGPIPPLLMAIQDCQGEICRMTGADPRDIALAASLETINHLSALVVDHCELEDSKDATVGELFGSPVKAVNIDPKHHLFFYVDGGTLFAFLNTRSLHWRHLLNVSTSPYNRTTRH